MTSIWQEDDLTTKVLDVLAHDADAGKESVRAIGFIDNGSRMLPAMIRYALTSSSLRVSPITIKTRLIERGVIVG